MLERIGMQRLTMREVAQVGLEKSHPTGRIDGLEHQRGARTHFVKRRFKKAGEVTRCEMFDHLNSRETANAVVWLFLKVRQRVTVLDVQAALAAQLDHREVGIHAA